jgi:acetyl esterase
MCAACDMETGRQKATVDPDLATVLASLAARGLGTPEPAEVGIAEARRRNEAYFRAISEGAPQDSRLEVMQLVAQDGGTSEVAVVTPAGGLAGAPALLYCHGGGYAFGDLDTHAHISRWLAELTGMTVFGLHYRRTPEHAYPAQVLDALAATAAIRGPEWQARFGHDPARVMLFGDSAGAHLCLSLMLALKMRNLPQAKGAALAYGMYARRFDTWSHHTYGDGSHGLSTFRMRWFWDQLMAGKPPDGDMVAEPLLAELTGLPPLALFGAECDCLLDDTLDFRENARRSDHPHTFHLFRGALHGFLHLPNLHAGSKDALMLIAGRLKALSA